MALIGMAVYSTPENNKDGCLRQTLESLNKTVDWNRHRLIVSVNAYTPETLQILTELLPVYNCIFNDTNIGTARAINKVWAQRNPGEACVKMDDDVTIHSAGWLDQMEEAVRRDPAIGQCGLKRNDLWEYPGHPNADFRSKLIMLPHVAGERWIVAEEVKHVIGTCVLHSAALIDKVGGLFQFGAYSYDDVIMSHRTHLAGFYSCFLPHIPIDHIDPGGTQYQDWKQKFAGEQTDKMIQLVRDMYNGKQSIHYPFE